MAFRILFTIAFFGVGFQSVAQEGTPALQLTYKEAVGMALQKNVNLNQQKNNLFSAQVQKNQSVAAFLPGVSIMGSASHSEGQQPNPDGGELLDISQDNVYAGIQAGVTIFNGFNRINTHKQAINQFKAQSAFVKRTAQDVVFNVTTQYLQVLLDQELLTIAEENHRAQGVVLEQLREQVRLGARAEADLYTQDAQVRNLELIALRAKVALDNDKALLSQTLQLDPTVPFAVEYPSIENTFDLNAVSLDSLYAVAMRYREDLRQAEYQANANLYRYKASVSGYLPSVTASAEYGSSYNSFLKTNPQFGGFGNQFGTIFPSVSYGVNVQIPLFDRLVTRNNRVLNKVAYDNSVLLKENVEKTIKIDVQRAYNNYLAAIQAYEAGTVQFRAGELALKTQQEGFVLGVASQVELAQANQIFVQAAASKAQADVTLLFQEMMLEYALGTLRPETLTGQ